LKSFENEEVDKINEKVHDRRLVQAVIARKGPLVGKTIKEVRFRTRYGAAVIAVHREGKRIHDHPGSIKLHAGDVLLLEAGPTFIERNKDNDRAFTLFAEVDDSAPPRLRFLIPALVIAAAMLVAVTAKVASLLVSALIAAILMVLVGIMSEQEARNAVNWEVYVTIACAFGIGTALTNSGVAGGVADFLVKIGTAIGIGGEFLRKLQLFCPYSVD
jgi:di/tricarboxylate transporter